MRRSAVSEGGVGRANGGRPGSRLALTLQRACWLIGAAALAAFGVSLFCAFGAQVGRLNLYAASGRACVKWWHGADAAGPTSSAPASDWRPGASGFWAQSRAVRVHWLPSAGDKAGYVFATLPLWAPAAGAVGLGLALRGVGRRRDGSGAR